MDVIANQLREPLATRIRELLESDNPAHARIDEKMAQVRMLAADAKGESLAKMHELIATLEAEKAMANDDLRENIAKAIIHICREFKVPVMLRQAAPPPSSGPATGESRSGSRGLRRGAPLDLLRMIIDKKAGQVTVDDCATLMPGKDRQALSQILAKLKKDGYLDSRKQPGAVAHLYTVTDKGREEALRHRE